MKWMRGPLAAVFGMVVLVGCGHAQVAPEIDSDRDGLSDVQEQALLERFAPRFQVSKQDCAVKPALFAEGIAKPTVVDRDGTIYGQVTPRGESGAGDVSVEVHYYDLWSVDCGRMGHPLDAEHVSVLLRAKSWDRPVEDWKAAYWFAAAHEGTMCDASQIATAKALDAEKQGATVWISTGKHGAFLSEQICTQGCGGDRCTEMTPLETKRVVNIGETGAAMHNAVWVASAMWPLAAKMGSDFTPAGMALLKQGDGVPVEVNGAHGSVKGTIYVANSVADDLGTSGANTSAALSMADAQTEDALSRSAKATGDALKKSAKAVGRFLRLDDQDTKPDPPPR
jgi:hypothetical protein